MRRRQKRNELLKNLIVLGVMMIFMILVLEIVVRITWESPRYNYPQGLHMPDDTKGYVYVPGFKGHFPGKQFQHISIEINSKGLRDKEHTYNKSGYRILALGDSVTFGAGVPVNETFPSFLEKDLGIEVIKAGVNGYEFDQQYTYYEEELYKYDADMVLYSAVLNDARSTEPSKVRYETFTKDFVARNFQLASFAYYTSKSLFAPKDYNDDYFERIYSLWEGETLEAYSEMIRALNARLQEEGKEFVVVIFPYTQQFNSDSELVPQEALKRLGEEEGFLVIDLYPLLNTPDYQKNYLFMDNVHLNARGNAAVAQYVAERISN